MGYEGGLHALMKEQDDYIKNLLVEFPTPSDPQNCFKTAFDLKEIIDETMNAGHPIVHVTGGFTSKHYGHTDLIRQAAYKYKREKGILIVANNADASLGIQEPTPRHAFTPETGRATQLCGVKGVDYFTFFLQRTPSELLEYIYADVIGIEGTVYYVKGDEYGLEEEGKKPLEEQAILDKLGLSFRTVPHRFDVSSTTHHDRIIGNDVRALEILRGANGGKSS
jgi:bifunctional ADP-heptose synthase (sugar kinase/adenylyltransferase)